MIETVTALLLFLNGEMIEYVYKPDLSSCLKSKRIASREINPERVIFSCKIIKAEVVVLGEDKVGQGDVVDLTNSKPKEGIVFAVCIFAVGKDGKKYLVDHRHAENMGECIKKRREAVNKYKDPKHRELMGGTRFMFMCDKVKAEVEILEDGTWHINKILGRYEPAYKKKKTYE